MAAKFTDLPLELLLEIWRKLKRRRDRQNFRMSSKSVFLAHPQYYGPSTVLHLRTSETAVEFADDVNNFKRLFPAVQFGQISAIILEFELDGFTLANWDSLIRALAFQHKVKRLQCQFALGMPGEWLYISRAVAAMPTCVSLVFDPCTLNDRNVAKEIKAIARGLASDYPESYRSMIPNLYFPRFSAGLAQCLHLENILIVAPHHPLFGPQSKKSYPHGFADAGLGWINGWSNEVSLARLLVYQVAIQDLSNRAYFWERPLRGPPDSEDEGSSPCIDYWADGEGWKTKSDLLSNGIISEINKYERRHRWVSRPRLSRDERKQVEAKNYARRYWWRTGAMPSSEEEDSDDSVRDLEVESDRESDEASHFGGYNPF